MVNRIIGILVILAIGILVSPFLLNPHDAFSFAQNEVMKAPPFPNPIAQNDTIKALNEHQKLSSNQGMSKMLAVKQKSHVVKVSNYPHQSRQAG